MKEKNKLLKDFIKENRREVRLKDMDSVRGFTFDDDKTLEIRKKIESSGSVLDKICGVFVGTSKSGFRKYVKDISDRGENDVDFVDCRDIKKYDIEIKKVIDKGIFSKNVRETLSGVNQREYILVTRMSSSLRAYKPEYGLYCGKVNCVYAKKEYDMGLIAALINTEIVTNYLCIISSMMHKKFISGDTPTLMRVVVPEGLEKLYGYTEKIQGLKKQGKNTEELERKVEKKVQELYGLTDEDVEYLSKLWDN